MESFISLTFGQFNFAVDDCLIGILSLTLISVNRNGRATLLMSKFSRWHYYYHYFIIKMIIIIETSNGKGEN